MNRFNSEDEYLETLNKILLSNKLVKKEIHSYRFGNADFRGVQFSEALKNGKTIHVLSAIKQFRSVSLLLSLNYSNEKELKEMRQVLSNLKIN